jgi:uncharacterized protein (TIGR01615 family)
MVRAVIRVPYDAYADGGAAPPAAAAGTPPRGPARGLAPPPRRGSAAGLAQMSKVPSLLFEMEDAAADDGGADAAVAAAAAARPEEAAAEELSALLAPRGEREAVLLLHVRLAREEAARRGAAHLPPAELAGTLRRLGYGVKLRVALGGGWGGACLRNLRHAFLAVQLPGGGERGAAEADAEVLVDPRFREQFEIAHTTPRYARLLEALAPEAAAPPARLAAAVGLLCAEMARAFAETGTPLPPWRQAAAMHSKWQPRRSEEVDVDRAGGAFGGAGGAFGGAGAALALDAASAAAALNAAAAAAAAPSPRRAAAAGAAAKLAALGVEPADRASPISEGFEELGYEGAWSSDLTDALGGSGAASGAALGGSGGSPVGAGTFGARRAAPATATAGRAAAAAREDVWAGIKRAVEALPERRNTWV